VTYPYIFQPLDAGALRFSNRIAVPPMVIRAASPDGEVTPRILDHYSRLVGAGLVVVEASAVCPEGRLDRNQIGVFDDRHGEGLASLAKTIHDTGAVAAIQIHHAGRNTDAHNTFGLPLVAPSAFVSKRARARELSQAEIEAIIAAFVRAAGRARQAGFDAVEIHAAHGYLVSQFLSPLANQRTDRWGGSLANRARFLREILSRIRAGTGSGLTAYCRLGAADGASDGLSLEEGIQVARWLEEDGVPLLHVSSGIGSPPPALKASSPYSDRLNLGIAVRKALHIPVIGVGGIQRPEQAEAVLREGLVDIAAVGRALLVDPQWIVKAHEGRASEIKECRNCNVCRRFLYPERCPAERQGAVA
jgi:2,4-dienoyl-CoA reductase-like NADH-dependent reductase (Old Yellow Enzyme family)